MAGPDDAKTAPSQTLGMNAPAFLLAQVGAHAAMRFSERLSTLDFTPAHAGVLRIIAVSAGINQRTLGERLGILPARLVGLIDHLEQRGLVERRRGSDDRRHHALHLTAEGRRSLQAIGRVARDHQEEICAGLSASEREQLAALLQRVAENAGLQAGVHPGFRQL